MADALVSRADKARDDRRYRDAASLYAEAIRTGAATGPIHVQAGHMFKEAGELSAAERHYVAASRLMPNDADLALQMGHFFKTSARLPDAELHYRRAIALKPGWDVPARELANLRAFGWTEVHAPASLPKMDAIDAAGMDIRRATTIMDLVPELMPRQPEELLYRNGESIHIRRLGRPERTYWGQQPTVRGVEAIRGYCLSIDPILEVQILLNGQIIHRGQTRAYALNNELENLDLRKYIFNIWLDFSSFAPGRYHLELYFADIKNSRDERGGRRSHHDYIVIGEPLPEPIFDGGDAWTPLTDPRDPRSVEEQVNARPSNIHSARRKVFKTPPKNVLVLRTDQLGDVVVSVPALRRLRELLPDANIVALVTGANADLLRTLNVVNEIIVVEFPDEKETQRKRVMTAENQAALRAQLAPYRFDLALDLAPAVESRPLLLLSGATFLAGMRDKTWPYIDVGFDLNTYDPVGRSDIMPASSKTLAFIESLGIMINGAATVVRRTDISRNRLERFDIGPDDHYAIIHTGARVAFSRWAHYNDLTQRVLDSSNCKIVMLSEDPGTRARLPASLTDNPRFQLLDGRLPFDDFDALLSFCSVFVGNDSGPKHLAALRGSNVVSLHTARVNWGEWGQEQTGVVISRQVPCAGCHIYHDAEECGKDYVCVANITVDEVYGAMRPYLEAASSVTV
jgi:ADP-heptose:LPS heptosyltransferase